MAQFKISGIWKNANQVITHYAFHTVNSIGVSRADKVSKAQAVTLLETTGNSATTWVWDYQKVGWITGEAVRVVSRGNEKYLKSNPDEQLTDNLAHLINFDWIAP